MKGLLLLSGGIDSPVAGHLMKQKIELLPLYFDNSPFTADETRNRAFEAARKLGFKKILKAPHGPRLIEFTNKLDTHYQCLYCRRMMYRVAEKLAKKHDCDFLVTGECLAQVASQTLQNLYAEWQVIDMPVLRPLIAFDKLEIIKIAKEIRTYDISTSPAMCCTVVPKKPATRARAQKLKDEEEKINLQKLIDQEVQGTEMIEL